MKRTNDDEEQEHRRKLLDLMITGGISKDLARNISEDLSGADLKARERTDVAQNIRAYWTPARLSGLSDSLAKMMLSHKLRGDLFIELQKTGTPDRAAVQEAGFDYRSEETIKNFKKSKQ